VKEPHWLGRDEVLSIHAELLHRFGGLDGVRDAGALDAALNRPINRFHYEEPKPTLPELAATYAGGIVINHPFIDGNKRTGFMLAYTFLGINGLELVASEEEAVVRTLALAARAIDEAVYGAWLHDNCEPLGGKATI
jgi:death-on-curing protein